jgi:omega-6 fatty acid desaturase (delta-12 desaturase)
VSGITCEATVSAPVTRSSYAGWQKLVAPYQHAHVGRAIFQIANTLIPLFASYFLAAWLAERSIWFGMAFIPLIGLLLVRTFIIMHDCTHGSFFANKRANDIVGFITGVLAATPYAQWRREHALHHASSGDLERRGFGDITTLTVAEYQALSPAKQRRYRLYRHPALLLLIGPLFLIIGQRWRKKTDAAGFSHLGNVWATNIAFAAMVAGFWWLFGAKVLLLIAFPAWFFAAILGIWLFYVQHQFENTYWRHHDEWDYAAAAIEGSSYLKLPKWLQWFTGNIGLHHIHHLGPRIPNYNLQRCHDEVRSFQSAPVLYPKDCVRVLRLALWDEQRQTLVRFSEA